MPRLRELGLKPHQAAAWVAWKQGYDLRVGISRSTFYRLRCAIKNTTGDDIAVVQAKSNVLQLPPRLIYYTEASQPGWADALTAALKE